MDGVNILPLGYNIYKIILCAQNGAYYSDINDMISSLLKHLVSIISNIPVSYE